VPVAAGLLGKYAAGWNATASLKQRLSSLAAIAREVARREHSETSGRPAGRNESATARFFLNAGRLLARAVFAASLLLILAVKIHVFLNID
jgi:hypothetical protein